jgi:hypothetical protein
MRALILAAMALALLGSGARAQNAAALKKAMVGQWELSTTDRSKTCVLTLKADAAAPGGSRVEFAKDCAAQLPFTASVAAWDVRGLDIVRLQDGSGGSVIDLTEVESGILEGVRSGEGVYILQDLAAARALTRSMDQMIGDWMMVRANGREVCGLTLTNTEAGADNFQVFLKPRCEAVVTAFAPKVWRLERGTVLLVSDSGETWRFEADDNAQWRRVPDSAEPLVLVRQ